MFKDPRGSLVLLLVQPRLVRYPVRNSLPSELRFIAADSTFRHRLKAELFSRAWRFC